MTLIKQSYQASADWAYDMYQSQTVWLRRSLLALIIVTFLLCLSLLSNLYLFPLKEKVPYLYAFDHATGEVTKMGTLEPTVLSSRFEVARYFLIHYVINYESYDGDNIDYPYQLVWAQSSDLVRRQYSDQVKSDNPNSPYRLYGKDKFVRVHVISINRLNDNTVDVKFEKTLTDRVSNTDQVIRKEAIIKWEYTKEAATQKMFDRNPLNFKVTYYQVSQVNLDNSF